MIINNKIYLLLIIMILVKNKLKKIKNTIDDEDMLNYLKYSHLEPIREDDVLKINTSNKSTQAPDIMNNFSQTDKKVMMDKETDTYDELNVIDPPYYLTMTSRNLKSKEPSRAEKMAHVWATTVEQHTPPSSNSEDNDEGLMSRNLNRGLRVAQLTGSAMLTALNITDTVAGAILNPVIGGAIDYFLTNPSTEQNEDEQNEEIPSSSEIEVEVEVEIVILMIIWGIDYYKGGQVEVEAILHHQAQQAVLKLHQKENNLNDYTFIKSCLIKGLG